MLEQSVDPRTPDGAGARDTEDDDKSIEGVEKMVSEMKNKLDAMQEKLVSLSKSTAKMQASVVSSASEEATTLKTTKKKAAQRLIPKEEPKKAKTEDVRVPPAAKVVQESRPVTESFPMTPQGNLTGMNILLLYADDWTHHTLSSYHKTEPINKVLKTPVLDALAADGIRFTHNCVTTSVCWISRATLYTGQYMSRHKTKEPCCWSGGTKPKSKLPEAPSNWKELSFYEILARHGYHVGHAGKWGVYLPFDKNVDFNVEEDGWHYRKLGKKLWHITEKNEADALRFLVTRPRDKPFFLNTAFYATHAKDGDVRQYMPQNASMEWYENDEIPIPPTGTEEAWKRMPYFFDERNEGRTRWHWRKFKYRMATEVDSACGAILEELRRQDALDNTVVIFTTDNGNYHSEHGLAVRDPRMDESRRGSTNDEFTLNIDLAPTILGAAGIQAPAKMMGRDISPLYLSPESTKWRHEWFYEHPIIGGNKHYIPSSEALVRKDYKYMYWPDYGFHQLFNLRKDPGEMEDIINSTDSAVVAVKNEMKQRFDEMKSLIRSEATVTL
ncbi:hypothetical protein THAOC_09080 [Thalassiosira oceanica]|uniref:Sulfatase N-terminal domain-containing protein n=1 Tax=Thalassiosira oceanica TaxID=159749 RepID=K0STB6_THAOC|nr:hypothetical protein THAOC_09080 [Thalassiosira oceanica]|eukprot:EJK69638.1 hypothetical protein THAOC_09080 [Thalassiosira oceanica]